MKRGTITIPAPIADKGDRVVVLNYRRKPDGVWEEGRVSDLKYEKMHGNDFDWTYSVRVAREEARYTLFVGDDGIEKL